MDGKKLKYERIKATERRAQKYNHTALCLPVYRKLVNKTTDLITPELEAIVNKYTKAPGRPGYNAVSVPYINDVGVRKAAAIAVVTTVNNFHKPITYQALAVKIGNEISIEWALSQEDSTVIDQINKYRFGSVGNKRKKEYLRSTLEGIRGKSLAQVMPTVRAAIGNVMLGVICRTQLIEVASEGTKGLHQILASQEVLDHIQQSHHDASNSNPVLLPRFSVSTTNRENLIRPQKGQYTNLSYIKDDNSDIVLASDLLNNVGWETDPEQLDFIRECAAARYSIMGLPYTFTDTFPTYTKEMDEERIREIKRARARMHSERNKNRARRVRLLSALSFLPNYTDKPCYFTTEADFRGRLYTSSELVSYQGPDWLRSVWRFNEGVPINDERDLNWLYIHAANCFGYSRIDYTDRINFIKNNIANVYGAARDPWGYIKWLEQAKEPFRFLAACREINRINEGGYGTLSKLPVQLDATSQGIQIWSTLAGDIELMEASNVVGNGPRDIYQEFADIVNDAISTSDDPDCAYFRLHQIDRSLAKTVLMVMSYGGSIYAIRDHVDTLPWQPSFRARQWLAKALWEHAGDLLQPVLKMQQRLAQSVSEHHENTGDHNYMWSAPSGVTVCQKYIQNKRTRIKDSFGNTIHTYRIANNKPDYNKSARAFPPNFVHSLDASILTKGIVLGSKNYNIKSFMAIHDCIGVHASNATYITQALAEAYVSVIRSDEAQVFSKNKLVGGISECIMGTPDKGGYNTLSPYLFS